METDTTHILRLTMKLQPEACQFVHQDCNHGNSQLYQNPRISTSEAHSLICIFFHKMNAKLSSSRLGSPSYLPYGHESIITHVTRKQTLVFQYVEPPLTQDYISIFSIFFPANGPKTKRNYSLISQQGGLNAVSKHLCC